MEIILNILKEFGSLTLVVLPYFIFGVFFGALVETYVSPNFVFKYLNKGISSIVNASLLGAILPGCSCATVPMADGLKRAGASLGTVATFVMVSPLLSPHTVILTYGMLGLKFTLARIFFSLVGAIILGVLLDFCFKMSYPVSQTCSSSCCLDGIKGNEGFWKSFFTILKNISLYFILGMFIASLLTTFIPEEAIPKYITSSGVFAYVAAVAIGIPLYVCEGEEIPITFSLLKLGLGTGPSLSFLLGSVGTCIPTIIMVQKIIGRRPTFFYILWWIIFAVGAGMVFSLM